LRDVRHADRFADVLAAKPDANAQLLIARERERVLADDAAREASDRRAVVPRNARPRRGERDIAPVSTRT
jgi:hypothetical protein